MGTGRGGDVYDDDVIAAYLSHRHAGTSSPNTVMEEPAFLDELGTVRGARVLDLGCGDGTFASQVLDLGAATYLGIDGSAAMIDVALRSDPSPGASFEVGDIEDLSTPAAAFDVVTSRMALHHVADLTSVLLAIRRTLVPGGRLVFSVVHPVITCHLEPSAAGRRTSWVVDDYFVPGPRTRPWFGREVTWHHRTVEQHVTAIAASGLALTSLRECEPDAALLADEPDELARRRRVPLVLLLAVTR